jgi:hypothetical protein
VGAAGTAVPDLLVAAQWKTRTGASGGDLPPGSGADALRASLTAVARDDPLVLLGSINYVWGFRSGDVAPGDAVGLVLRVLLAATPDTSLLIGIDAANSFARRVRGTAVPGTERLSTTLDIGLSTVVGRDQFVDVTVGVGVTPAAPAFQLAASLPFRLR